jgi:membrane protein
MAHAQNNQSGGGNVLSRFMARLDAFQQKHPAYSFTYAVIKKYGDDDSGHQAALITYYGFLSLFPLLLVATSVIDLVTQNNADLRNHLLADINSYFPVGGQQLQESIHASNKTGLALVVGLLFALYGARGIADVMRGALDHAWAIPRTKRIGFPRSVLKSFGLLLGAGLALTFTTTLISYATATLGQSAWLRVVPFVINIALLYLIFMYVFLVGTSRRLPRADVRLGALCAAVGLMILQTASLSLARHQLRNLHGLYGQFALVLAMLFWIYLQAQVFMYAIQLNVAHAYRLWPRSITGKPTTEADRKAYTMYAEKEAYRPKSEEQITVNFNQPKD